MGIMHLIKLCVGIDSVEELAAWQTMRLDKLRRAGEPQELIHRTRQTPRKGGEVVKSGSLYWAIKGSVRARRRLLNCANLPTRRAARFAALCLTRR